MDQSGIAVAGATGLAEQSSRSKDRTVSLFFLPKPLHSPHPLSSYIALPSSRSLFKTNMVKVCARSRRSNGKIGDCEQSIKYLKVKLIGNLEKYIFGLVSANKLSLNVEK